MATHAASTDGDLEHKTGLVWLASYPKSGNTWTRAFLSNLATILAGESNALEVNAISRFSAGEYHTPLYEQRLGFKPTAQHRREIAAIRHEVQKSIADEHRGLVFVKTHNGLVMDYGRSIINFAVTSGAVYIVRNPLDVSISLAHHMGRTIDDTIDIMKTRDLETPINETRVHEIWGSWSQHVESWTRRPHRAIFTMRYEEMLNQPRETFGALVRHLLIHVTPGQLDLAIERSSFANLKRQEEQDGFVEKSKQADRFFREGRANQWKDVLTSAQVRRIVRDHGEQMAKFDYLPK